MQKEAVWQVLNDIYKRQTQLLDAFRHGTDAIRALEWLKQYEQLDKCTYALRAKGSLSGEEWEVLITLLQTVNLK